MAVNAGDLASAFDKGNNWTVVYVCYLMIMLCKQDYRADQ